MKLFIIHILIFLGAYYLQNAVKQFNTLLSEELPIENKKTENITAVLSHLYNFKVIICIYISLNQLMKLR